MWRIRYVRPSVSTSLTREIKIHECTALIDATFLRFFFSFLYFSSFRFVSIWQFTQKLGKKFFDAKSGMVSSRFGIWLKWRLNVLNFVSCNRDIYFEFLFLITWWRKLNFEFIEFLFLSVKVNGKFFDKQDCRIGLCRLRTFIEFLSLEEDGKIVF